MKAPAHALLVRPTGDNDQTERGRIIVVQNDEPARRVFRGVVLDVGKQVVEDIACGNVAYYGAYVEITEGLHAVSSAQLLCYEDDE